MQKIRHDYLFGSNIRSCRLESKLTQGQVVAQLQVRGCKISRETYAKIESGIANIRVDEVIALGKIFKIDINKFFTDIE